MSGAPTVAPGLLIAERYRLESLVPDRSAHPVPGRSASRVGQLWLAHDEVLARPVAVLVVSDDDPLAPQVLAGARAAAGLTHPALARVYDAGESPGVAFVVTEYFAGGSLEQQLQGGALDPVAAVELVGSIAEAVAAAHRAGIYGMTPAPSRVLFTTSGVPRLAGVALAADPIETVGAAPNAAAERRETAERADTVALAFLLYAGLTGRWPGDPAISALPPAPYAEGHVCTPRQVRGGVPREADVVVTLALGDEQLRRGMPAIDSPLMFATALAPLRAAPDDGHPYGADTAPIPLVDQHRSRITRSWLPLRRRNRIGVAVAVAVLSVAVAGLFWTGPAIYPHFATHANSKASTSPTDTPSTNTPPGSVLVPASVSEFDPYGDHTDPHVDEAPKAIDGDLATAWHTQTFGTSDLGHLKPGVGLLVDLGSNRRVSGVRLHLLGDGTAVTLLDSNGARRPASDTAMTAVATASDAGSDVTLRPSTPTSGRYWLIWLTRVPAGHGGFQGGIAEITFES